MNREPNVCLRSRLSCPQLHRLVPWLSCSSYALTLARVGTLARTSTLARVVAKTWQPTAALEVAGEAPCQPSGGAGAFTAGANGGASPAHRGTTRRGQRGQSRLAASHQPETRHAHGQDGSGSCGGRGPMRNVSDEATELRAMIRDGINVAREELAAARGADRRADARNWAA